MIHVKRGPCPPSLDPRDPNSAASKEFKKALHFYRAFRKNAGNNFNFEAYSGKEVKRALRGQFHHKCAYCESPGAEQAGDIEHFRPKGGVVVNGKLDWPGYWWLAADWKNLLLSCADCNRRRYHEFPGDDEPTARGKENLFPVREGSRIDRIRAGAVSSECELLLDPCRRHPETYLDFLQEAGAVAARDRLAGEHRQRAEESIEVYGLDRPILCQQRAASLTRANGQAKKVGEAFVKLKQRPTVARRRRRLADEVRDLQAMCDAQQPYAAVARAVADDILDIVRDWLDRQYASEIATSGETESIAWLLAQHPARPVPSVIAEHRAILDAMR